MGALTLRIGSRRTLAASLLGLAMATLAFARASSLRELLAARALQGAASAALMSGGLTLVAEEHAAELTLSLTLTLILTQTRTRTRTRALTRSLTQEHAAEERGGAIARAQMGLVTPTLTLTLTLTLTPTLTLTLTLP